MKDQANPKRERPTSPPLTVKETGTFTLTPAALDAVVELLLLLYRQEPTEGKEPNRVL